MLLKVFYIFHEVMSKLSYYVLLIIVLKASINMALIFFYLQINYILYKQLSNFVCIQIFYQFIGECSIFQGVGVVVLVVSIEIYTHIVKFNYQWTASFACFTVKIGKRKRLFEGWSVNFLFLVFVKQTNSQFQ